MAFNDHLTWRNFGLGCWTLAFACLVSVGGCSQAEKSGADKTEADSVEVGEAIEAVQEDEGAPAASEELLPQMSIAPDQMTVAPVPKSASSLRSSASFSEPQLSKARAAASDYSPSDVVLLEDAAVASGSATGPFSSLPGGATHSPENGFATVAVYYATDRAPNPVPLSAYRLQGAKVPVIGLGIAALICGFIAFVSIFRRGVRSGLGAIASLGAVGCVCLALVVLKMGVATVEKHGVTYTAERGILQRGIATVTVPDSHQRGKVERPSLLRFEFKEDQTKHIVMTSAMELNEDDFYSRMNETVAQSPEAELLVFIHGYNVDFESAVQRTAQLAVDLPFKGVPVCYSWPSQGELLGYTIDENNVAWTVFHLKTFLYELVEQSGATSVNLIAHSMGNRALTAALSEITLERSATSEREHLQGPMFDRIVLAAPDVDADHFRRDLAPRVLQTANTVTLYASSDDKALIASKQVHGYPRAGESGPQIVIVPGIETVDVTGIDLSLLGHSYYGDSDDILKDLFDLVHHRLPAAKRKLLSPRELSGAIYWQLTSETLVGGFAPPVR